MKHKKPGKLVMHGDDTWLKLFPGIFDRADGTTSFFVSDFTEVDTNVTRHVPEELENDDWNTMVLHYLGLDHIGHKTGPRGPNMVPKQHEMDGIVRQIYEGIQNKPHLESTLLVLIGDHGMNDAGNHGASSAGETSPALVFVSPKLKTIAKQTKTPADFVEDFRYYSFVEQSDLAPTLAALLGFPIPKNSLGSFITEFLPMWQGNDRMEILLRNGRQIYDILVATFGVPQASEPLSEQFCSTPASTAESLACAWRTIQGTADAAYEGSSFDPDWLNDITKWLNEAQSLMTSMASNYDVPRLTLGSGISAAAVALSTISVVLSSTVSFTGLVPYTLITLLYGIMMFASSYVEEEQHFWYWATSIWFFFLTVKSLARKNGKPTRQTLITMGSALLYLRVLRNWNQTGQKFAGEPDIVTIMLVPHPSLLWLLVLSAYALVAWQLYHELRDVAPVISGSLITGLVTSAVSFKLAFTREDAPELMTGFASTLSNAFSGPTLVELARAVFMGLGLAAIYPVYILLRRPAGSSPQSAMRTLHMLYTIFAMTQSRATNIPLFIVYSGISTLLVRLDLSVMEVATTSLLLQFASFFAMAGNNAISGIDLSSAYNGVSGFDIGAVGVLTFLSNWAAPVWWSFWGVLRLLDCRHRGRDTALGAQQQHQQRPLQQYIALQTAFVAASLAFVMAACMALRTHLFIWTVFSPKYLYSMAWSLGQHLGINVLFGSLLYWLGH
ncbi:hypothetical protein Micbo1qcDRAFT_166219 [Microdochium bolleyi]|uniref:GPI ethanolamine phosphate transferase 2 n=1 Tax=Microdochium bolleyi TaxID=196109 RepID=A0A136IV67_9PEZI|nr:hypothetical protein Micbo1qcDRAFT_166219 [Microdochium bolleyi]